MQKMKKPHAGTQGKGIMEHFQGWMQCSTEWAICQDWVMTAVIVAGVVLI